MPTVSNLSTNHRTVAHHILVAGISPQRIGVDQKPVHVAVVVDKVVLLQDFLLFPVLRVSSGSSIPPYYILLFYLSTTGVNNRVFEWNITVPLNKGKGKDHPITAREGPEGE
jgi:hypothetical protein